jgi:16S rRNA (adenine1518-N6/adenine1519-N6)-dimethyltransferase
MKDSKEDNPSPLLSHHPLKRFGQHFLTDQNIIRKIISAFNPRADETIIEIGPGTGALTDQLVAQAGKLIAVEFDRELAPILDRRYKNHSNFTLVQGDALDVDFCSLLNGRQSARVIANLPYNISTAILQRLISQRHCLTEMILMLQKEVVDRMVAPSGGKDRGFLSVLVEAYCQTERLFDVSPGAFKPPPKIWSSVVKLNFKEATAPGGDESLFIATVSAGFAQKRKTILNNFRNATGELQEMLKRNGGASIVLCKAEVELQRRAETLTFEEWDRIVRAMR